MATVNERLGGRACPLCGAQLVIRRNPAGTVTFACSGADGCDASGFAKKGTKAAALLTAGLAGAEPAPSPSPAPAPEPARTKRQAPAPFNLGGL